MKNILENIKKYYPDYGYKGTSEYLGISIYRLQNIIKKNNLTLVRNRKVEFSNFENITKKEVAYFLGFFWSDGTVFKNSIDLTIKTGDSKEIFGILSKFGTWNIRHFNKKLKDKVFKSTIINCHDKKIAEFLIENDYLNKSLTTPTKILKLISDDLKPYFFRGLIDGDGCFCSKNRSYLSITGNINQNWDEIIHLYNNFSLKFKLTKKERKTGNSSFIVISNKKDIIKLGDFLYGDSFDGIGLSRKYKIYLEIKNKPISKYSNIK